MAKKEIITKKFGGTSVATASSRQLVVNHIKRSIDEGFEVAVVVSAIGRRGDPYATDTLLDLLKKEGGTVSDRNHDFIFQTGEIISVALMSHILNLNGIPSIGLTGAQAGIQTNGRYRRGKITKIDTKRIRHHINNGVVPIVTGGQGISNEGEINILGRGSSDTSGVALGAALKSKKIEIYTDVPGIAIADPRIIPQTTFLEKISYEKLYLLGMYGAKVVHPRAVSIGKENDIPIVCRSTFDNHPGTLITKTEDEFPLVGITRLGPVSLVLIEKLSLNEKYIQELYDYLGVIALKDEYLGKIFLAVKQDWVHELKNYLSNNGINFQESLQDRSLVSLIGTSEFIDRSFSRVESCFEEKRIDFLREKSKIRSTFAVPNNESTNLIVSLYKTLVNKTRDSVL